jgi:hypothetical protein
MSPIAWHIDPDERLVVVTPAGRRGNDERFAAIRAISEECRLAGGRRARLGVLVDLREAVGALTADEARQLVDGLRELCAACPGGVAILAAADPSGDAHYGMARVIEAMGHAEGLRLRACRDEDEARAWLGDVA